MRFLLFLILVCLPYVKSQKDCEPDEFPFLKSTCTTDDQCNVDPATNVAFGKGRTRCTGSHCCFKSKVCESQQMGSLPLIDKTKSAPYVITCKQHGDCDEAVKKLKEPRRHQCNQGVCCSVHREVTVADCPMGGKQSKTTCTLDDGACSDSEYCDVNGCCPLRLCKGSTMLPMNNVSETDNMKLMKCQHSSQCESEKEFYPNSYCSSLNEGEGKYCCPIPYSKSFRDSSEPQHLFPSKLLPHHNVKTKAELIEKIDAITDEFSKACKTNEDCGDEEFCDEAVNYEKASSTNVEKMKGFIPKICFPAPRCAGKAAKEPGGIGIKMCTQSSECDTNEFCDIQSNAGNPVAAFNNLGVCCQYDCTEEATLAKDASNTTMKFYAQLTVNSVQCNNDNDCTTSDVGGRCITVTDKGTPIAPLEKGKPLKLCCVYPRRKQEDLYRCLGGDPAYDTVGDVIKCEEDKDCNKVEGQPLSDQSTWDFECVTAGGPGEGFCCPVAKCKDRFTYMRTENDCKTQMDCLKDEEEKKTNADGRAVCSMFYEKNEKKPSNKCCPIGDLSIQLPYCTKRGCATSSDCKGASTYCHPKKKSCCYIGLKRIDGKTHVNSTTCQGTCPDKEIYGTKAPQYCALPSDGSETGMCFLSPYIIIEERNRQVNPVLKTSLIISIVMTLIFAFLALIMFVNYRSKNFCDKYTPKKRKGKKGKKGKKDDTTTGGRSTKGDSSSKSAMSGTSATGTTGGGTTGGGTTGDGTTGGGTTGDASSTGTAA